MASIVISDIIAQNPEAGSNSRRLIEHAAEKVENIEDRKKIITNVRALMGCRPDILFYAVGQVAVINC